MMEYVWLGIILVTLVLSTIIAVKDLRSEDVAAYSRFFSTVAIGSLIVGVASVGLAVTMFMG